MAIEGKTPPPEAICDGCLGEKNAPMAVRFTVSHAVSGNAIVVDLCQECGRDAANAIGAFCIRDGGWSKLEPRKRRSKR